MWKTVAPVLVALTLLPPSSARAIRPGGCVVKTVEVEGTLGYLGQRCGRLPNGMAVTPLVAYDWEGYFIKAGDKTYILDLPPPHGWAESLMGKRVRVSGLVEYRTVGFPGRQYQMPFVRVHTLVSKDTVEIKGTLRLDPTEIKRPFSVSWYVASGDQRYYLDFGIARELEKLVPTLTGEAIVTGRLEFDGRWLVVHVSTLKAREVLQERACEGNWEAADTILALKSGDRRPLIEHVRDILGKDLKSGLHTLRLEGSKLVVRTTAANHARIEKFLRLLATIPGPVR